MEKMIFRVEWGYWHGYFSKEYLRKMDFSGHISVNGGTLECVEKIVFKHDDWGPHVFSRQYEMLPSNSWNSRIHNWLEGIRFSAYVDESSVIILYTNMIKVKFSVGELIRKRHLVFNPAEKYSYAVIHVEIDDEKTYWFTPKLKDNQTMISFEDFDKNSMIVNMFTLTGKMIARRQNARANFSLNKKSAKAVGSNIQSRLRVRYLLSASDKTEVKIRAIARFKILINGQEVWQNRKFSMWHDVNDQLLEEVWTNIDSATLIDGKNTIEVINEDYFANVIMQNLVIEQNENAHLEVISSPTWVLTGEPFSVTVKSNYASSLIKLNYDKEIFEETINGICEETYPRLKSPGSLNVHEEDKLLLSIGEGEHEFFFVAKKSVNGAAIEFCDEWRNISSQVIIPEVWGFNA